jgi:hypothetical protein
MLVLPKPQPLLIVAGMVALTEFVGAKLRLFINNIVPTKDTLLGDFTEPVFTGYNAQTLTYSSAFYDAQGNAVVSIGEKLFTLTSGVGATIYGGFLTDSAGAVLLGSFALDGGAFGFTNPGDTLALVGKLSVNGGVVVVSPGP